MLKYAKNIWSNAIFINHTIVNRENLSHPRSVSHLCMFFLIEYFIIFILQLLVHARTGILLIYLPPVTFIILQVTNAYYQDCMQCPN